MRLSPVDFFASTEFNAVLHHVRAFGVVLAAKAYPFIHMSPIPDTNPTETRHDDRYDLTAGHFCAR